MASALATHVSQWSSLQAWMPLLLSIIAGLGTSVGGVLLLLLPLETLTRSYGELESISAGIMVFLSYKLYLESSEEIGYFLSLTYVLVGLACGLGIEKLTQALQNWYEHKIKDDEYAGLSMESKYAQKNENLKTKSRIDQSILRIGSISFITMALHNFPEGISVALTTASNPRLGIMLCVAILLHNILEGMVVGLPILYSTQSGITVFLYTLLNGLAEPAGVLAVWFLHWIWKLIIGTGNTDNQGIGGHSTYVNAILAIVSGIMIGLSFLELLPHAYQWMSEKSDFAEKKEHDGELGLSHPERTLTAYMKRRVFMRVTLAFLGGMIGGGMIVSWSEQIMLRFM